MSKTSNTWHLYLIKTKQGHLYTGITTDVERRFKEHQEGYPKGAKYLNGKGPIELVFSHKVGDRSLATKVEFTVKALPKNKKEEIINNNKILSDIITQHKLQTTSQ